MTPQALSALKEQREQLWSAIDAVLEENAKLRDELDRLRAAPVAVEVPDFSLESHLYRQGEFSERTFGPGPRPEGIVDHIQKELREILASPDDLEEWIDVVILAFDGAMRSGHPPRRIISELVAKQTKNEARTWPDWRSAPPGKAIEHIRAIPSDRVLKEGEREELETWKRIAQDAEKERDEAQSAVARLLAWKRTILARMGALLDSATNARGAFSSDALRSQRATKGGAK